MPVTDIRVSVGFFDHYKTLRLRQELGADAVIGLLRIWCFAAQYRPKGVLFGLSANDLCEIASWNAPGDLVGVLKKAGFLKPAKPRCAKASRADADSNAEGNADFEIFEINDWSDHNRFAFYGPERQQQSRKAAKTRWHAKRGKPRRRKGSRADADSNADSNAEGNADRNAERNAPIPTPTPTPVGGGGRGSATPSASPDGGGRLPPLVVAEPPMTPEEKQRNREELRRVRAQLEPAEAGHA